MGSRLPLRGANPFCIRAYRNLARTLDSLAPSVAELLARGAALEDIPGVGHHLAGKDGLRQAVPAEMHQLMARRRTS